MQTPWGGPAYWLDPCGLLSFIIEPRTTCPGVALFTISLALAHQTLHKKIPYSPVYSLILLWRFLFEVPSSPVTVAWDKMTKKLSRTSDPSSIWHTITSVLSHKLSFLSQTQKSFTENIRNVNSLTVFIASNTLNFSLFKKFTVSFKT